MSEFVHGVGRLPISVLIINYEVFLLRELQIIEMPNTGVHKIPEF